MEVLYYKVGDMNTENTNIFTSYEAALAEYHTIEEGGGNARLWMAVWDLSTDDVPEWDVVHSSEEDEYDEFV